MVAAKVAAETESVDSPKGYKTEPGKGFVTVPDKEPGTSQDRRLDEPPLDDSEIKVIDFPDNRNNCRFHS